jgi:hypothetical protein
MRKIIITDLTRFNKQDDVCTAGTDVGSGQCVRPMPYLKTELCVKLGILPGAILSGDFVGKKGLVGPHQEDADYSVSKLRFEGPSTSDEFKEALEAGLHDSVERGFKIRLKGPQKHIPMGHPVKRSIITLAVDPGSIEIVEGYKQGTTKIHFVDGSGRGFSFLPITDLGFHRYADTHRTAKDLARLNAFIHKQSQAYLRLGLSRSWLSPQGINGYWMQVNGVYTFPDFFPAIRSYKS